MKKSKYIYLIIIFLLIFCIGCKGGEEEKKNDEESKGPPPALEQVRQLTDEIVDGTMAKEWAISLDKTKELQTTWNELFPELQKKGVPVDAVNKFVADMNTLSDYLISKTLNLPQKPSGEEMNKEQNQTEEQGQGHNNEQQSKPEGEEQGEQKQEEQKTQQNDQGDNAESQSSLEEENKNPKEILDKIDPMISVTREDLVIINSSVEVTKHIPEFMALFEGPIPPDVFKLKYLVRHLNVASKLGSWDVVTADFKSLMETWSAVQPKAMEVDPDLKIQLNQGITELNDVIIAQNTNLVGMKCNLIVENIDNLVKKIEDKEKEKEEEQK